MHERRSNQAGRSIYGATLLDVTPTVLTLFGVPVGEDIDGRVLVQAFEQPPEITRIPSWEQVLRDRGALDISLPLKAFHYPSGYINSQRAVGESGDLTPN